MSTISTSPLTLDDVLADVSQYGHDCIDDLNDTINALQEAIDTATWRLTEFRAVRDYILAVLADPVAQRDAWNAQDRRVHDATR